MSCDNENEYARLQIKYTSIPGASPSLPYTQDHNDGTWSPTDLYVGEFFLNASDDKLWIRTFNGIIPVGGTGSGTGSYVGDFVSKTMGGSYSGTVSVPHLNGNDLTYVDGTFTNVYTTDLWATTLHGDGSGLTGIISEWNGGTVSGTSSFTKPTYFNDETWLDGNVRSSYGEIVFADNLSSYGTITANTFVGDGSQLTGITGLSYSDIYTTSAWLDGTVVRFDRNDISDAYSVDLTPLIGTYSPQSFNWDGANTMTVYLVDGSYLTMTLDTFDTLNANTINANEVYANTFYGSFVGDFLGGMTGSTGPAGPAGATGYNGAPGTNGFMIVDSTWSNFITRYGAGTLTKGVRYKITDLSGDNIGTYSIWIDALDVDKVSNYGILDMTVIQPYVYDYSTPGLLGVWSQYGCGYTLVTPSIGDIVVWGGYLWENTTGFTGTYVSQIELDSNWTRLSTFNEKTGSTHYFNKRLNVELNFQQYTSFTDWDENMIVCLRDDNGNTVYRDQANGTGWKLNDWGNNTIKNNTSTGIYNNISSSIRDNKVKDMIMYNQFDIIENNDVRNIILNYGAVSGGIYENFGGIIANNKVMGMIRGNRQPKDSTLSDNGSLTWYHSIEYNMCNDITSNINNGDISYNNIANVISDNNNDGIRTFNINAGSVVGNTIDVLEISYNSNTDIMTNSNTGNIIGNQGGIITTNSNHGNIYYNNANKGITYNTNQGSISYNVTGDIISTNSCIAVDHVSTGDINNNVIPGYITNNSNGDIQYNTNNGSITLNLSTGGSQIRYNSNNGDIRSNDGGSYGNGHILNNSNNGNIISNTLLVDGIYFNSNGGHISTNTPGTSISYNSNTGEVSYNIVYTINNNSNSGEITSNTSNIDIHDNSNGGWITSNTNTGSIAWNGISGGIASNTNTGGIFYNTGSGNIYNNSNSGDIHNNSVNGGIITNSINGYITWNSIGGQITSNTQTSGTTNISWNNNNGNIGPAGRTGNILGTQVNL